MSLTPLGKLEIRNGVTIIETANHAVAATNPMIQQLLRDVIAFGQERIERDTTHALIYGEAPMARTTSSIRMNVYDGPHHGRILIVPANSRHIVLPNPMPAGEMWGPGRSRPQDFASMREVTYEVRTSSAGMKYLSYVEGKRAAFQIPVAPSIRISSPSLTLVRKLRDEGYNYGVGSNGSTAERYAMMQRAEKSLVEHISKLEREASYPRYQGSEVRY